MARRISRPKAELAAPRRGKGKPKKTTHEDASSDSGSNQYAGRERMRKGEAPHTAGDNTGNTVNKQTEAGDSLLSRLYATILRINQTIVRASDRETLFSEICQVVIESNDFCMAWIGLIDETDGLVKPVFFAGEEQGYLDNVGIKYRDPNLGRGPTGTAIRDGNCTICQDIATDPHMEPWREAALQRGYRSSAAVPFREGGNVIGALSVYATEPYSFGADDEKLLNDIGQDISFALDAMRTKQAMQKSEAELKEAQRVARIGNWDWDARTDKISWSEEYYHIYGFDPNRAPPGYEEHLETYTPESAARLDAAVKRSLKTGEPYALDLEQIRADGTSRWFTARGEAKLDEAGHIIGLRGTAQDITERQKAEAALRESEARYRGVFEGVQDAILVEGMNGDILDVNQRACDIFGYSREEFLTKNLSDLVPPEHTILRFDEDIAKGTGVGPIESVNVRSNGERFQVEISGRLWTFGDQRVSLIILRDITKRKQDEEKLNRQLEHLTALKNIDRIITSNFDLKVSLEMFLAQAVRQLHVDAADILVLDPGLNMLEFHAGSGFRAQDIEKGRVRLGEGYPGRAAMERRMIQVLDLSAETLDKPVPNNLIHIEGFVSYWCVPLIAKGQVKGVMEVFNRSTLHPQPEWVDFLETLAQRAAIAIDNIELFENLQRSNNELVLAYDATIAGWSRAMDLRDKETEGHSQRVTELSVELAQRLGVATNKSMFIRWGALLHDIGKIGIPDEILHKPAALNEEEWKIIKRHPEIAYEMLSPIHYLAPALDIPYCHHEKWDGTGYPRGLKGEQIPLSGRIFAVVDVWDALRSDRPYRPAWSEEKALEYIREQSGKHFDPDVVKQFVQMIVSKHS